MTRRNLLAWLGRATVVGLFSPLIEACVRPVGPSSPIDGGPTELGRLPDLAGGLPDAAGGDLAAEAPGADLSGDAGGSDATGEDGTDLAADADGTDAGGPCDPALAPGDGTLPIFTDWGERTVDPQDLAGLLASWRLTIDGLVDHPLTFDFCQVRDLGLVDQVTDFHCVEGWSVYDVPWNGVPLSVLLDLAGVQEAARYLTFTSVGGRYTESLPLDVAREPHSLLGLGIGGKTLPLKHGFPARIVVPRLLGYKNAKYVTRIQLEAVERVGFWPSVGYPVEGLVPESRLRPGHY